MTDELSGKIDRLEGGESLDDCFKAVEGIAREAGTVRES